MKKTQLKDWLRNIRSNFVSWLAIVIVLTIGCGTYCGSTFYINKLTEIAADFFAETNYEDLKVTSALGFTEDDIEELKSVDRVQDAEGTYRVNDAFLLSGSKKYSADVLSLNNIVSKPALLEGDLPIENDECALTIDTLNLLKIGIGDSVSVSLPGLKNILKFKVTGRIDQGEQFHTEDKYFVYVPKDALEFTAFPDRFNYLLVKTDVNEPILSDSYFKEITEIRIDLGDKLSDLQDDISEADPGFLITDRMSQVSYVSLKTIIDGLNMMMQLFVVIFLIISMIVVFSTITVLIDNQKSLLGSLKAFGFRNNEILMRYLLYSETAALFGLLCIAGLSYAIQMVVNNSVSALFTRVPDPFVFEITPFIILSILIIILTGITTVIAVRKNIGSASSFELMNWNGFGQVVQRNKRKTARATLFSRLIMRNMQSDLARVITSVVVIAGCSLIVGGSITMYYGLKNSPKEAQKKVTRYDIDMTLPSDQDIEEVEDALSKYADVTWERVSKTNTFYRYGDHEEAVTVIVAENHVFTDFINLDNPDGKTAMKPNSKGVLVQNRISERTGIKAGDYIDILDGQMGAHEVKVRDIFMNYQGRVMYLSERSYENIFGTEAVSNALLIRMNGTDIDEFAADMNGIFPGVSMTRIDFLPETTTRAYQATIIFMIILSLIMSVFVLLNLVNIYVNRRQRELIIMSINGFSHREQIGYLLREAVLTILLGILLGVVIGAFMTKTIVQPTEQIDNMSVRTVNWMALGIGAGVETFYALIIYLFAFRRIRHLSLIDA